VKCSSFVRIARCDVSRNWVVRCNPSEFLLDKYIYDGHDVTDITDWFVSYRFADIHKDDRIVLWVSGAKAGGGSAFGFVTGDVSEGFGDSTYWTRAGVTTSLQHFVPFRLMIGTIDQPIRWASLKADPTLKQSLFARRNGRNPEELTDNEWRALMALLPHKIRKTAPRTLLA
jgi:hypothetical protein